MPKHCVLLCCYVGSIKDRRGVKLYWVRNGSPRILCRHFSPLATFNQGGWDSIPKNTYKTITLPTSFNHCGYSGSVQWDYPSGISSSQSLSYALGFDGTTGVIIGVQSAVANPVGVSYVVIGR